MHIEIEKHDVVESAQDRFPADITPEDLLPEVRAAIDSATTAIVRLPHGFITLKEMKVIVA